MRNSIMGNAPGRSDATPLPPSMKRRWLKVGLMSLLGGMLLGLLPQDSAAAAEEDLTSLVAKKAAIISNMHTKARRAIVNAAQDHAFNNYFTTNDPAARQDARARIEKVTLATQARFHVEEMCLIDPAGVEITRIVGNKVAPDDDLSTEESSADFFAPGFAEAPRQVYISPPYMSPDANKWTLAYVTPVIVDGAKKAILHYEHGLDIYQDALNKGLSGNDRYLIAISAGGFVISDSRKKIDVEIVDGKEDPAAYFQHVSALGDGISRTYGAIGAKRIGTASFTASGTVYGLAYNVVEGNLTLMAVEKKSK